MWLKPSFPQETGFGLSQKGASSSALKQSLHLQKAKIARDEVYCARVPNITFNISKNILNEFLIPMYLIMIMEIISEGTY